MFCIVVPLSYNISRTSEKYDIMKNFFIAALLAVTFISSAFAAPVKGTNYFVANSFKARFPNVLKVDWIETPDYAKATFLLGNVKTEALYQLDGTFIGTCQKIAVEDLPIAAKRSFAKRYADYTVKEAVKFESNEELAYFISAEDNTNSIVLKVVDKNLLAFTVSAKKL